MANIKSQKKRNRQNKKRWIKNSQVKSSIRTSTKAVLKFINSKEEKDIKTVNELYKNFVKTIDTAARKKIVTSKTAARKKSRLAKKVNTAIQEHA